MFRRGSLCGLLAAGVLLAAPVHAGDDWQAMTFISSTLGNNAGRLCTGAPGTNRPSDLGCPTYAPYVTSAGNVGIGTNNPSSTIHIAGAASNTGGIRLHSTSNNTDRLAIYPIYTASSAIQNLQSGGIIFFDNGNNAFANFQNGGLSVGHGNTPVATLQVSGSFIVSTTGQNSTPTLYVGTSGRVGIGTSVPTASNNKLFIYDPSAFLDMRVASGANSTFMGTDSSRGYIGTYSSVPLFIQTSATTRVAINATGDVGIGTSSPNAKLDVAGTISSTGISVTGIVTATYFEGNGSRLTGITAAAAAASSTGAIQFNVANAMAGDGANLFWDDANNRLGIGTATPIAALDVNGNIYAPGGFVSATYYFNALAGGLTNSDVIRVNNVSLVKRGTSDIQYGNNSYWQTHSFYTNGSERFRINGSGNVGISTTNPNAKLEVSGLVSSTGLSVTGIVTATYFEGDGSRLTGLSAATSSDRIVSGTATAIAYSNSHISTSVPLRVSSSIQIITADVETCAGGAAVGTIRINPATGAVEMCRK